MGDDLRKTYDRIAQDWYNDHKHDSWQKEVTRHFGTLFAKHARILDIGGGPGIKAKILKDMGLDVEVADFSEGLIEEGRKHYPDIPFRQLDIRDVDSLPDRYDGIFAFAVLLHLKKSETFEVLKKLAGRLKPNGKLFIGLKEQRPDRPEEEMHTEDDYGYEYTRFFSYYSAVEVDRMLQSAGLNIIWRKHHGPVEKRWYMAVGQRD